MFQRPPIVEQLRRVVTECPRQSHASRHRICKLSVEGMKRARLSLRFCKELQTSMHMTSANSLGTRKTYRPSGSVVKSSVPGYFNSGQAAAANFAAHVANNRALWMGTTVWSVGAKCQIERSPVGRKVPKPLSHALRVFNCRKSLRLFPDPARSTVPLSISIHRSGYELGTGHPALGTIERIQEAMR